MFRTSFRRISSIAFQYASDIHLEKRAIMPTIKAVAPNLILAGDIGDPLDDKYSLFLDTVNRQYDNVYMVAGNHEYYQKELNVDQVNELITSIVAPLPNIHFLNNNQKTINDNLNIVGTTLWSRVLEEPKRRRGDDLRIRVNDEPIGYQGINRLHEECRKWLDSMIRSNSSNKDLLVVTHYLPSYELILDRFKRGYWGSSQDRFASDLDYLIKDPVKAWICGHSHICHKTEINQVPVRINSCPRVKRVRIKKLII